MPPLKPATALAAADSTRGDGDTGLERTALERGRLMHVLLQYLPQVSSEGREAAAQAFLKARAEHLASDHAALIGQALAVLEAENLTELFGPRARSEVAIVGRIITPKGLAREVSGQVDRIVETEREVIIADYKTGTVHEANDIPPAYLIQMALYRAVLRPLWAEKQLRMLLIFTAGPKVVELQAAALDETLARLDA